MRSEFWVYFLPAFLILLAAQWPFFSTIRHDGNLVYCAKSTNHLRFIKFSILYFCVFGAFSGDWFHSQEEITGLNDVMISSQNHLEDIYIWLIRNITKSDYILFRIIVWSLSFFCLDKGLKRLDMDNVVTWTCFISLSVTTSYAVGRGSLGFSLIIWGYSCLLKPNKDNKITSYITGLILLGLSLFCHKSMFLLAPLTLLSFVSLNVRRTLFIGLLIILFLDIFQEHVMHIMLNDDEAVGKSYFKDDTYSYGVGMNLWLYSYYFIIFGFTAIAYYRILVKKIATPLVIKRIFNLIMLIFFEYLAIYFAFTYQGLGNDDLAFRVFAMMNIPLPIVVSHMLSKECPKFILNLFIYSCFIANYFIAYNIHTNY